MRPPSFAATALAVALSLASCETTRNVEPAGLASARAQALSPERAWRVLAGGDALGRVVLFAAEAGTPAPCASFYSVQNLRGQELGMVDAQGRAWRYEVHQREARWLVTGTLLEGTRAILGLDGTATLAETPLERSGNAKTPR